MYRLAGSVANGAARKGLLGSFGRTLVTLTQAFLYEFDLTLVTGSSRLHQWHVRCKTHAIHMISCRSVIKCIHDESEFLEEREPIFRSEKSIALETIFVSGDRHICVEIRCSSYEVILSWYETILQSGLKVNAVSRATADLDLPTCCFWNKNCLLRLLTSMVSRSICKVKECKKTLTVSSTMSTTREVFVCLFGDLFIILTPGWKHASRERRVLDICRPGKPSWGSLRFTRTVDSRFRCR